MRTSNIILAIVFSILAANTVWAGISSVAPASPADNLWVPSATPGFTFTAISNSSGNFSCELLVDNVGFGINATTFNDTSTIITANASLSQGTRLWNVNCTDLENSSTSATWTVNVDTGYPTSNITFPGNDSWTTNTTPSINFTITDVYDSMLNYTLFVDGVANLTGNVSNNTVSSLTMGATPEGTYTLIMQAEDEAGNMFNSTALVIHVDTANPTSVITSPADNTSTSNTTPAITFTLTDSLDTNLSYVVYVDGSANQTGSALNNTPTVVELSVLGAGVYTVLVQATDSALHSVNSTAIVLTVDVTAPTSVITSPANDSWTTDTTPDINFILTDETDTVINYTLYVNGVAGGTGNATNNTVKSVTLGVFLDGTYTVVIEAADSASNLANGSVVIHVDTTVPTSNITSPANDSWTNDVTPEINFTLTDNMDTNLSYVIYVDGVSVASGTALNGTPTVAVTSILEDGSHDIEVQATDNNGNAANSSVLVLKIDATVPVVSTLNAPSNNSNASDTIVTFNFTSYDGIDTILNYTLFLDGVANATGLTAGNNTATNFTVGGFVSGTTHNWTIQVEDNLSNAANFSGLYYFTVIDTTPPTTAPTLTQVGVNDSDSDGNIELNWTADANAASYKVYRSTTAITSAAALTAIAALTNTTFEDNTTTDSTTYWYAITSLDASSNENKSIVSSSYNATADDTLMPRSPTTANGSTKTNGAVNITWTAVTLDVDGNADLAMTYYVFRTTNISSLNTSNTNTALANTTNAWYQDTTMTSEMAYSYVITSLDDGANHNSTVTVNNTKNITPSACDGGWSDWSDWSTCSSSSQTRTRTRTCYGGGSTSESSSQSCTTSSSGSGGSSAPRNTNPNRVQFWGAVPAGQAISMKIDDPKISVVGVGFKPENAVSKGEVLVQQYASGKPSSVKEAPNGHVYQYLEITLKNMGTVGNAWIEVRVPESWLEENGILAGNVRLFRLSAGEWQMFKPTKITEETYRFNTPGFSTFAIGAEKASAEPAIEPEVSEVAEDLPAQDEAKVAATDEQNLAGKAAESTKEDQGGGSAIPYFIGLAFIVVLAIIFAAWRRPKKPTHHHEG
ncbi:MAG: Ig-like domain-containing protein [Candidatus Woesearchaeota archaeon]